MVKRNILSLSALIVLCVASCEYDNIEPALPDVNCDTPDTISYTNDIVPILNTYCGALNNACHTSVTASGNVILDLYAGVNYVALNGAMMSSITWDGHATPMPLTGGKLSQCKINKIQRWISDGAPAN
jgi:hypothetical protein